jgi:hypothetical protein
VNIDLVGTALRSIVAAHVIVEADPFFLLRVDRDRRLVGSLEGFDLRVDMFELSVAAPRGSLARSDSPE